MPKVSILVPVYKAEKTLDACVESILAQTFPDFELLLIDDESPDPPHCELTMNCGKLMLMWSRCYITPAVPMWKRTLRWRKPPCRHWCTLR